MKTDKKVLLRKCIIYFIVIMIICTVAAGWIDHFLMPKVTCVNIMKSTIKKICSTKGYIDFTDKGEYISPVQCRVSDVYVEPGDKIEAGKAMMAFDLDDLKLYRKNAELNIIKQQDKIDELNRSTSNNKTEQAKLSIDILNDSLKDAKKSLDQVNSQLNNTLHMSTDDINNLNTKKKTIELNILKIQQQIDEQSKDTAGISNDETKLSIDIAKDNLNNMKKNLSQIDSIINNKGYLTADNSIEITSINVKKDMNVSNGQILFSYCKNPGQAEVCFELSKDNGKLYEVDDEISAVLSIAVTSQVNKLGTIVTETNVEDKTAKLKITDKKFSADKGIYAFKATVDGNKYNLSMPEKASVDVTASYTTCQYDYVMPKSSITFTDENTGYVYLLQQKKTGFTKKYYVKRYYVTVKSYSDADAAVEGPFYYLPVVVSSSKPLSDGMTVKVW